MDKPMSCISYYLQFLMQVTSYLFKLLNCVVPVFRDELMKMIVCMFLLADKPCKS